MAKPFVVTDKTFHQDVLESSVPIIVDFWAEWCGPCRMVAPVLETIAQEQEGKLKVAKLEVDVNPETASEYGVMSIPTIILFKGGRPVERVIGYMPKERLMAAFRQHLS